MAKRVRIGLLFSYDESWVGGAYYTLNLIHALNTLDDDFKPHLTIIADKESEFEMVKQIGYPYVSYLKYKLKFPPFYIRAINKIFRFILKENLIKAEKLKANVDIIFPGNVNDAYRKIKNHLFWIPDFQEDYLPEFFSSKVIKYRKKYQYYLAHNSKDIIFSSKDAFNDFNRLYPDANGKYQVVNFAVNHPKYDHLPIKGLKLKYKINKRFFFSPNQFWKHKNHIVVLEALKILKDKNMLNFQMVFSGKEEDNRNPNHVIKLKKIVKEAKLDENICFLGFIDRAEQLQLMNHAIAIIQPSLFEGWSTVIEDAKSMNQLIIASDLDVHKEQLGETGYYFNRRSPQDLIKQMLYILENDVNRPEFNYYQKPYQFGDNFMQVIYDVVNPKGGVSVSKN